MENEVFLVEELENRLAIEGVNYKRRIDNNWETEQFDPAYFENFISGPLYAEFITAIYDRIKPLNSHEINRFLTLSVAQFKTHTPEKRENNFVLNYWHTYWFPNAMDDRVNEHDEKYAKHIWKHYTKFFHLFQDATEKALSDFKAGLLGQIPVQVPSSAPALQVNNAKLKTNLSVAQLAFLFKMLKDLKPSIFEIESEAELLRFISANFETKKSTEDGISTNKLRILFNQPETKAAEFWEKHFYTFIAEVKKFK